jgi:hypothetical protein
MADLETTLVELIARGVELGINRAPAPQPADDDIAAMSVQEFATRFSLSEDLVLKLLDRGDLPELPRWSHRRLIPRRVVRIIVDQAMADWHPEDLIAHLKAAS